MCTMAVKLMEWLVMRNGRSGELSVVTLSTKGRHYTCELLRGEDGVWSLLTVRVQGLPPVQDIQLHSSTCFELLVWGETVARQTIELFSATDARPLGQTTGDGQGTDEVDNRSK